MTLGEDQTRLQARRCALVQRESTSGATAIGTGINTDPSYARLARKALSGGHHRHAEFMHRRRT